MSANQSNKDIKLMGEIRNDPIESNEVTKLLSIQSAMREAFNLQNISSNSRKKTSVKIIAPFYLAAPRVKIDIWSGVAIFAVFWKDFSGLGSCSSWFDYSKTVIYAVCCVLLVLSWMLKPTRTITNSSSSSSLASDEVKKENLGNLMAAGAIFFSALGIFCNILATVPVAYAATVVSICSALVLLAVLHEFYCNPIGANNEFESNPTRAKYN